MNTGVLAGVLIPFFGTALGAGLVLFMKREFNFFLEDFLSALAGGIMTAASVWSLIIPATEDCAYLGRWAFLPCCIGIIAGCIFMMVSDKITDFLFSVRVGEMTRFKTMPMILAVTIHNIPEGMAVGCVYASAIESENEHLLTAAFALALGIAVQNIPEGAVISMPLYASGKSKGKAILSGVVSGVVEPLGAVSALLMARVIGILLPYFLSFAAGAMLFVVAQELIGEIKYSGKLPLKGMGFTLGFMIMMSLDVALS